jgi:SsrA-binding protein
MAAVKGVKVVADNRKAYHEYFIEEKIEAGIELSGTEVKSIRQGNINIKESYVNIREGEIWLVGCHISPFEQGNRSNKDPLRTRKLLMHKREIMRLFGISQATRAFTLIPTLCYFRNGKVKIEVGVARGKKNYDKRQSIAARDAKITSPGSSRRDDLLSDFL